MMEGLLQELRDLRHHIEQACAERGQAANPSRRRIIVQLFLKRCKGHPRNSPEKQHAGPSSASMPGCV
jgi:hypothetical protein